MISLARVVVCSSFCMNSMTQRPSCFDLGKLCTIVAQGFMLHRQNRYLKAEEGLKGFLSNSIRQSIYDSILLL